MKIKEIKNYPNYAITDNGEVYNLRNGKIMRLKDNQGYLTVKLCKNGKPKEFRVHRLVYQAFIGELDNLLVIDHIDGNRHNNNVSNLRQIHTRENTSRAKEHPFGQGVHFLKNRSKYTSTIQINCIRYHLGCFDTAIEAEDAYLVALDKWNNFGVTPEVKGINIKTKEVV